MTRLIIPPLLTADKGRNMFVSATPREAVLALSQIEDPEARQTSGLVDASLGRVRRDGRLSKDEYYAYRAALLEQPGSTRAARRAVAALDDETKRLAKHGFEKLDQYVATANPFDPKRLRPQPKAPFIDIGSINDDALIAAAKAIAQIFGGDNTQLAFERVLAVDVAIRIANGELKPEDAPAVREAVPMDKLEQALEDKSLDPGAVAALELFMLNLTGTGVADCGPARIRDQEFEHVFPLPLIDASGRTRESDQVDMCQLQAAQAEYEKLLEAGPHPCGYDRIYFEGPRGGLFVALNARGKVNAHDGSPVQLMVGGAWQPVGKVIPGGVVDIDNSLREGIIGFNVRQMSNLICVVQQAVSEGWKRGIEATSNAANKFVGDATRAKDAPEAAEAQKRAQPRAQKGSRGGAALTFLQWIGPAAAGIATGASAIGAQLGAAVGSIGFSEVLPVACVPLILMTGFNVLKVLQRRRDLTPFYEWKDVTIANQGPLDL